MRPEKLSSTRESTTVIWPRSAMPKRSSTLLRPLTVWSTRVRRTVRHFSPRSPSRYELLWPYLVCQHVGREDGCCLGTAQVLQREGGWGDWFDEGEDVGLSEIGNSIGSAPLRSSIPSLTWTRRRRLRRSRSSMRRCWTLRIWIFAARWIMWTTATSCILVNLLLIYDE